jgi:hypothetical protein
MFQAAEDDTLAHWKREKSRIASQWRSVVRNGVKTGNLKSVLDGIDYEDIDRLNGRLVVIDRPVYVMPGDILFGHVVPGIKEAVRSSLSGVESVEERDVWYERLRDCCFECIDEFWFCLGVLAYRNPIFPETPMANVDSARVYRVVVRRIVRWWPELYRLDPRMDADCAREVGQWMSWGLMIPRYCYLMGVPLEDVKHLRSLDMRAAGELLAKWVAM